MRHYEQDFQQPVLIKSHIEEDSEFKKTVSVIN